MRWNWNVRILIFLEFKKYAWILIKSYKKWRNNQWSKSVKNTCKCLICLLIGFVAFNKMDLFHSLNQSVLPSIRNFKRLKIKDLSKEKEFIRHYFRKKINHRISCNTKIRVKNQGKRLQLWHLSTVNLKTSCQDITKWISQKKLDTFYDVAQTKLSSY